MAKYTDQEKQDAVSFLVILNNEGTVSIDDYTDVSNVRDLCKELGISSYTLYKWAKNDNIKSEIVITKPVKKRGMKQIHLETLEVIDEITKQNGNGANKKETRLIVQSEIRFFGNLAGMLGIKGYGSLPLKQLQLRVGLELVKRSGLGKK